MAFLHILLSIPQVLYSSIPNIVKHSLQFCDLIIHSPGLDDLLPPGPVVEVLEGDVGLVAELQPRQAGQRHLHRALEADTVQIFLNIHGGVSVCLFVCCHASTRSCTSNDSNVFDKKYLRADY